MELLIIIAIAIVFIAVKSSDTNKRISDIQEITRISNPPAGYVYVPGLDEFYPEEQCYWDEEYQEWCLE